MFRQQVVPIHFPNPKLNPRLKSNKSRTTPTNRGSQLKLRSNVQQEAQRLYAELLFFMFYILYIYIFLVIFLQKFNFYGFYIAVAPRLNSI